MQKIATAELPVILPRMALGADALAAIDGIAAAADALEALVKAGFLAEATRLLSHALPKREAVWWACMCCRHTPPAALADIDREAIEAAELWVRRQTDEVRRAAFKIAERTGFKTAEGWAAVAAFWSGESMSPIDCPPVPPLPHMAGSAVSGAVALAAVRDFPERQNARLARFLDSGREVAAGGPGRLEPEA